MDIKEIIYLINRYNDWIFFYGQVLAFLVSAMSKGVTISVQ